jgi:hypothetical protein
LTGGGVIEEQMDPQAVGELFVDRPAELQELGVADGVEILNGIAPASYLARRD